MLASLNLPTFEAVTSEICKRSLYEFVKEFWEVLEPGRQFKDNWHIQAICEHLEAVTARKIKRLIINIPPRHMKSLICSVFWPVWVWIKDPSHRWLCTSYAQNLSTRDSIKCRRLIQSDKFQKWYGARFVLTSDQNQKTRFENDKTGYRIAASVGGQLTGDGGDTILVDDAHNVTDAESILVREGTIDWFDNALRSRLNDPDDGAIVIIMQRVHEADLVGHLVIKDGDVWDRLVIPARYDPTHPIPCKTRLGFTDPRTVEGELLWPERITEETLKELEEGLGSYGFAGQFQQRPSPREGGMIKREWFQFYDALPENPYKVFQSWDLTFKKTNESDFVAGLQLCFHEGNIYVIDGINSRLNFPETQTAIIEMKNQYPNTSAIYIEDKANGPAIIDNLKGAVPGLIPINPGKDSKESRASAGSAHIRSGNVFLKRNHWLSDKIISQCCTFPNGANDDLVDALMQAIRQELGTVSIASLYEALMDKR